jgi:hypothetical protein
MNKNYIISVLLISVLTLSFVFFKNEITLLTYTESSQGLQTISLESGRTELEFADLNNDGYLDIISIGDHGNPLIGSGEQGVMVWFGNGTGTNWNLIQGGNLGYGGIAVGDVNNDGKQDIGYGMHHNYSSTDFGDQILEVALGNGTGTNWTPYDDSLAMNGETWGMFTSDFGDIDNDGLLDIGSISFGCCNGIHVYKNLGNGTWRQTFAANGGNSSMEFSFGDINKDGNLDFAAAYQNGTVYFGTGTGNFNLAMYNLPVPGNTGHKGVTLGDVDNDGAMDIGFIGTGGAVNVWKFDRTTLQYINLSSNLPASGSYSASVLYDMDSDGFCDLVLYGGGTASVWKGNGGTNWVQSASFSVPSPGTYSGIDVADADRNGYPDIALQTAEQIGMFNYLNKLRFFKESTPYSSLLIKPIYPKGFEYFKPGSICFIKWISSVPQTPDSRVKLQLSTNGPGGSFTLIADSVRNDGEYQWSIPSGIASANCYIKYTVFLPGTSQSYTAMNLNPFGIGILTDIEQNITGIPTSFALNQNYPNPFNPTTKITFKIPSWEGYGVSRGVGPVSLRIYDIAGRLLQTLVSDELQPGTYEVTFVGSGLNSGVYFYKLTAGSFTETKKMLLIK